MSDDTSKVIIDRITINFDKPTTLPTGQQSKVFYDCIQLTPNELARLSATTTGHLGYDDFDIAIGLAHGGIFFAAAVASGRQVAILQKDNKYRGPDLKGRKVLIVDDVIHSGTKVKEAQKLIEQIGGIVVGFVCIVDRSGGNLDTKLPVLSAYQAGM